jgi:hypothetical protein
VIRGKHTRDWFLEIVVLALDSVLDRVSNLDILV